MEVIGVLMLVGLLAVVLLWATAPSKTGARFSMGAAHDAYCEGDVEAIERELPNSELNEFVALSTAMGKYREAIAAVEDGATHLLDPKADQRAIDLSDPQHVSAAIVEDTERINVADALFELGELERARQLLEFDAASTLGEAGRLASLAWLLGSTGLAARALPLLDVLVPGYLGPLYECEGHMVRAFVMTQLGRFDDAEKALELARSTTRRASSERNRLYLEGALAEARGNVTQALERYDAAANHRWKQQGGPALLRHGDLLAKLGRLDDAQRIWRRAMTQDPQSPAAKRASERLK